MRPALIATDLDGTFLGTDSLPSQTNVDAVLRAAALGIPIVVATGRPARWLQVLEPIRPAHPYVLASNGAVVFDLAEHRVVEAFTVPVAACRAAALRMREVCPEVNFGVEYDQGWGREAGYALRGDFLEADVVADLDEVLTARPVVKLLVMSEQRSSDQLAEALLDVIGDELTTTWSFSGGRGLLEVSALGVTKAHTLALLCEQLGVDVTDVVAFGDMPNDLAMLQLVGHPFVMGDCHPLLAATGFPSAGGHDESGVGHTINRLLDEA